MSFLSPTTLLQNALTEEERSRVLVLYARGLRLLFTLGSAGHPPAQWGAAMEVVYRELLLLAFTRHGRLSETVRLATDHFFRPTYQVSYTQLLTLYQVMAQRLDAEAQGGLRLTRLLDLARRKRRPPRRRPVKTVRRPRHRAHRKTLRGLRQRQPRTRGTPRARGGSGTGGAVPVQARVEELLTWVRRVMEQPGAEDLFTLARELLKKR
jgi:hypothetical protein